jgi:hypothetical protein
VTAKKAVFDIEFDNTIFQDTACKQSMPGMTTILKSPELAFDPWDACPPPPPPPPSPPPPPPPPGLDGGIGVPGKKWQYQLGGSISSKHVLLLQHSTKVVPAGVASAHNVTHDPAGCIVSGNSRRKDAIKCCCAAALTACSAPFGCRPEVCVPRPCPPGCDSVHAGWSGHRRDHHQPDEGSRPLSMLLHQVGLK